MQLVARPSEQESAGDESAQGEQIRVETLQDTVVQHLHDHRGAVWKDGGVGLGQTGCSDGLGVDALEVLRQGAVQFRLDDGSDALERDGVGVFVQAGEGGFHFVGQVEALGGHGQLLARFHGGALQVGEGVGDVGRGAYAYGVACGLGSAHHLGDPVLDPPSAHLSTERSESGHSRQTRHVFPRTSHIARVHRQPGPASNRGGPRRDVTPADDVMLAV